jgi:multidrug efflux pump subunit AcrB
VFLFLGFKAASTLKTQFFPDDVQYWSYADIWLPNNAPLTLSNQSAQRAEDTIRRVVKEYEQKNPPTEKEKKEGKGGPLLAALTTFVGGGGPRFWFSANPEMQQTNYAEVLIQLTNKKVTPHIVGPIQAALSREVPGTRVIVHQLQTNPVEVPVEIKLSATADVDPKDEVADNADLRRLATQVEDILRSTRGVQVVYNEWSAESPQVNVQIDPDRANLEGLTNSDIANSTAAAISGTPVTSFRECDLQIPVIARLVPQERAQLADIQNLYVYSSNGQQKVPLRSVATTRNDLENVRIRRQEHFRMMRVNAYPQSGVLSSEVLNAAMPKLDEFQKNIPPGYRMELGGEKANQVAGFQNLVMALAISLVGIYGALLLQFNNAVKPMLVFAATPYGVVGALLALVIMGSPFGFMAFLGIVSLIGVIISHVIVLFDFIEEMHEEGEPFEQAVRDAGIHRLRPVMITVAATILALFPLASSGGPLWQPLCYAQIGGLAIATFITLLLVPVFYSIAVLDLKVIKWEIVPPHHEAAPAHVIGAGDTGPAHA